MEEQTFRSRLVELLKKSRKASRLYSGVGRTRRGSAFAEVQAAEWLSVNNALVVQLSEALEDPSSTRLTASSLTLLSNLLTQSQLCSDELANKKQRLVSIAESGDFVQTALLSKELVATKARLQALQAAYAEVKGVVKRARTVMDSVELNGELPLVEPERKAAKIIPFRQRQAS